jgi:hypothetical protein
MLFLVYLDHTIISTLYNGLHYLQSYVKVKHPKKMYFAKAQEAVRKDVERAFRVL